MRQRHRDLRPQTEGRVSAAPWPEPTLTLTPPGLIPEFTANPIKVPPHGQESPGVHSRRPKTLPFSLQQNPKTAVENFFFSLDTCEDVCIQPVIDRLADASVAR